MNPLEDSTTEKTTPGRYTTHFKADLELKPTPPMDLKTFQFSLDAEVDTYSQMER